MSDDPVFVLTDDQKKALSSLKRALAKCDKSELILLSSSGDFLAVNGHAMSGRSFTYDLSDEVTENAESFSIGCHEGTFNDCTVGLSE